MKHLKLILISLLLIMLLPSLALASDISNALFYGTVLVTNNSTATTNVATVASINTTNLQTGGFLNANADDCAIQNASGADVPFMPGYTPDGYPWCIFVPTIGDNQILSDILYTANSTGGDINYFSSTLGGNTTDSASLEPGGNFTISQTGFVNASVSSNATLASKPLGMQTWIDSSADITSGIGYSPYLSYDGVGDYCTKAAAVTAPSGASMAVEAIFRIDAPGANDQCIFAIGDSGGAVGSYMIFRVGAADKISWRLGDGAGGWASIGGSINTISLGEWHAITFSYDDTATPKMTVYLDGSSMSITDTGTGGNIVQPNTFMTVGATWTTAAYTNLMIGDIDEVRVSDAARTEAEHDNLYKCMPMPWDDDTISLWHFNEGTGNPSDETGNNDLTRTGATWSDGAPIIEDVNVTAQSVAADEYAVTTTRSPLLWAPDNVLDFDGTATSYIDCGAIYNASAKLWISLWFKLDNDFAAGGGSQYLYGKRIGGNDWARLTLGNADGKLNFFLTTGGVLRFNIFAQNGGSDITSWTGGQWYHVIASTSDTPGIGRLIVDDGTVVLTNDVNAVPNGGNFVIGSRNVGDVLGFKGNISNVIVGTDDLTPAEETALYNGTAPGDETDLWYIDEGTGTNIVSYGSAANAGTAGAATSWDSDTRPCKFALSIDGTTEDGFARPVSVNDSSSNWTFIENYSMLYLASQNITIGGTLQQDIEWEYDTIFADLSGNSHDMNATFRTASSDPDVSANLSGFLPISEATAPAYALGTTVPFIDSDALTGNITDNFTIVPSTGGFPLAGVIVAVANATSTPPQLPLLLIAGFVIITASLVASYLTREKGSGSITVKIITICAFMGIFIALRNFGIDFWMMFVFLIFGIAFAIASRQFGWS